MATMVSDFSNRFTWELKYFQIGNFKQPEEMLNNFKSGPILILCLGMSDDDYQVCTFLIYPADCSRINARFGGIQFANLFHHRNGCAAHKRIQCCRLSQDLQRERFIISKCLSHHNICKGNIQNS